MKLHHRRIANLPKGFHPDGMGLRYYSNGDGTGNWPTRCQLNGKTIVVGLGAFPETSLKEAREANLEARGKAKRGIDPRSRQGPDSGPKRLSGAPTVRELAATFEAIHVPTLRPSSHGSYRAKLKVQIVAKLGDRDVSELDLMDLHLTYGEQLRTQFKTTKNTLEVWSSMLAFGRRNGLPVDERLISDFKQESAFKSAKKQYQREKERGEHTLESLRWQDWPDCYAAIGETDLPSVAAKLVILTALRRGSVHSLRKDQVGKNVLAMDAEQMKADRPHDLPVTPEVSRLLNLALALASDNESDRLFNFHIGQILRAIRRGDPAANNHGTRHAIGKFAKAMKYPREQQKAALQHSQGKSDTDNYVGADDIDALRDVLTHWESHLLQSNLVQIAAE